MLLDIVWGSETEMNLIFVKVSRSNCRVVEVTVKICMSRDDVPFVEPGKMKALEAKQCSCVTVGLGLFDSEGLRVLQMR